MARRPAARRQRGVSASRRADLRGRGARGPLLPPSVPGWQTRSERFDALVLEALAPIDRRWHDRLSRLDIAVDDVPPVRAVDAERVSWPPEVVGDGAVQLSRLVPAGVDRAGATTRARIVLFRRPLELRAPKPDDLADLLHDVLVEQVATYLELDVDEVDPDGVDDDGPDEDED
ncbi:metallopeptidase family protein [Rhodococcus aerolatus]